MVHTIFGVAQPLTIKFRNLFHIPPGRLHAAARNADASDVDDGLVGRCRQLLLRTGILWVAAISRAGKTEGVEPIQTPNGKRKTQPKIASNSFFEGGFWGVRI